QGRGFDSDFRHQLPHTIGSRIHPNNSGQHGSAAKCPNIRCDVARSTKDIAFSGHFDDGHGSFRRNAADASPYELVEHHVTEHQNAFAVESSEQRLDTLARQTRNHFSISLAAAMT